MKMETLTILFACMIIPTMVSLLSCQHVVIDFDCSQDQCSQQVQKELSETPLTLQVNQDCGECSLHANLLTPDHMMILSWKAASPWDYYNYFYINQTGGLLGFTGPDDTCQVNIYQNELHAKFSIHGEISIEVIQQSNTSCHTTDCAHNCNSLHKVQVIFMIRYKKVSQGDNFLRNFVVPDTFPADFVVFGNIFEEIGKLTGGAFDFSVEARGQYPTCTPGCTCSMHINRFVAHCENGISRETLILQQKTNYSSKVLLSLDVEDRGITTITKGTFQGFQHINLLSLSNNPLIQVRSDVFEGLESAILGAIELRNCTIKDVPSGIFAKLLFLAYIDLSENLITSLHPDTLSRNLFLRGLVLRQNQLSALPTNLFRTATSMQLLDLRHNQFSELNPDLFDQLSRLQFLVLDHNHLHTLQPGIFKALRHLDSLILADNKLTEIPPEAFERLTDLNQLDLSRNNLSSLVPGQFMDLPRLFSVYLDRNMLKMIPYGTFGTNTVLQTVAIDGNELETLDMKVFSNLSQLSVLNLSNNNRLNSLKWDRDQSTTRQKDVKLWPALRLLMLENNTIDYIDGKIFEEMPKLKIVNVQRNPLKLIKTDTCKTLSNQTRVFVTEGATCCFTGKAVCTSENPKAPYLTCQRLLPTVSLQAFIWVIGVFAVVGNLFILIWRCIKHGHENEVQILLILNLAAADLLMGVYMLIIASADRFFEDFFPSHAETWRNSPLCKVAGILSILSSEASVFLITIISLDRFLVIRSSIGKRQISKKTMTKILLFLWVFALVLSIVPTLFSGVDPTFYDVSEVCIGLPFVQSRIFGNTTNTIHEYDFDGISAPLDRDLYGVFYEPFFEVNYEVVLENGQSPGLFYSVALFLVLNLICFIIIAFCYCGIFIIFSRSQRRTRSSSQNQQLNLAIRMGLIVLTDFLCWMPIILIGILVQSGAITISPVVYVYIVVFVLPINSAANPFLYSVATIISDYKKL